MKMVKTQFRKNRLKWHQRNWYEKVKQTSYQLRTSLTGLTKLEKYWGYDQTSALVVLLLFHCLSTIQSDMQSFRHLAQAYWGQKQKIFRKVFMHLSKHLPILHNQESIRVKIIIWMVKSLMINIRQSWTDASHSFLTVVLFSTECRVMKGPKAQRGSAKSPGPIKRSKSPAESSEPIIISPNAVTLPVETRAETSLTLFYKSKQRAGGK